VQTGWRYDSRVVEPRFRHITFVTRNYELVRQGVTRAVFGPCAIGVVIIESFSSPGPWALVFGLVNIFGFTAVAVVLWVLSTRWMNRRFGRVRTRSPLYSVAHITILNVANFALTRVDNVYGVAPGHQSMQFLGVAAYGLWVCVRLWPYAIHYTVPTAVAFAFALRRANLHGAEAFDTWFLTAASVTLFAWTAAGLIDLALLVKVLPEHRDAAVNADAS